MKDKNIGYKLLSEHDVVVYVPEDVHNAVGSIIRNMFSDSPEPIWKKVLEIKSSKYQYITPSKESMKDMLYLTYCLFMDDPEFFGVKFEPGQTEIISNKLKGIEEKLKKMNDEVEEGK